MSTVRTAPLSASELDQYKREGWVTLGRILDDAMLNALRDEEARFRGDPAGQLTIFRSQLAHQSEPLRKCLVDGPQVAMATQLVGTDNLALWFNQFVTKLPDAASGKSEFPWHQDNGYVAIEPATNVTIWVALDDVDEQNGCVWVVPHSHEQGLLEHKAKSADSWHLSLPVEGDGIPAILKAGDAVAFTGLTLHRSKLNYTQKARRAFFMEYAHADATIASGPKKGEPIINSSNTWVVKGRAKMPTTA